MIISTVNFITTFFLWLKFKKRFNFKFNKAILNSFRLDKTLLILLACFIFMLICFLFLSIFSLPIEPDTRMYHFSRIFDYINQGSFNHFDTNEIRNTIMPVNSEMVYSYFYIFTKNEFSFGLLSYFSFIFLVFGLFNILLELKIPIRKSIFAIFVFSSLTPVLIQIPSLQTDILVASFIVASIYLFIKYFDEGKNYLLFFSSLSYALAIGTKTTAIMNFVSLFILFLGYIAIYKKNFNVLLKFALYLSVNFVIFSSYNYVLNYIEFGAFVAPISMKLEHLPDNFIQNFQVLLRNFIHAPLKNYYDERTTSFFLLGIFAVIPSSVLSFFYLPKINKKLKILSLFGITFFINFILHCITFEDSPYSIRYFVEYCAICAPCFVLLYCKRNNLYKIFISLICILNLLSFSLFSTRCPLYIYFKADYKNLKEDLIMNKQKYMMPKFEYLMQKEFQRKFNKNDKIAVLNNDFFYEIKRLENYNTKFLSYSEFKKTYKDYDYLILFSKEQISNHPYTINTLEDENCNYISKTYKGNKYAIAVICRFDDEFLKEKGYISTNKTILFKTYKNTKDLNQ